MANSQAIIAASKDPELCERAVAIAAELGIERPQSAVEGALWQLAAAPIDGEGNTVASMYEYTAAEYEKALAKLTRPGANMSGVTDAHLRHALRAVFPESAE